MYTLHIIAYIDHSSKKPNDVYVPLAKLYNVEALWKQENSALAEPVAYSYGA